MGLNYMAKRPTVADMDLNVDGCDKLAKIHRRANLPLSPGSQDHRVPYVATANEVHRWAKALAKAPCPRGLKWLQQ